MTTDEFVLVLKESQKYFEQHFGEAPFTDGFKLSIQGQTLEDSWYLFDKLIPLLAITKCSFKFGTQKLIDCEHPQQKHKLLTIYLPNGVDPKSFAELVHLNIPDYEGGKDVKHPDSYEHYKGSIYYRNDRDEDGNYITAN